MQVTTSNLVGNIADRRHWLIAHPRSSMQITLAIFNNWMCYSWVPVWRYLIIALTIIKSTDLLDPSGGNFLMRIIVKFLFSIIDSEST